MTFGTDMAIYNSLFLFTLVFTSVSGGPALVAFDEPLMCTKGRLVFEESFSSGELDARWSAAKGDWKIVDGVLQGTELKADKHAASIRTDVELPATLIMQFDFKFDGGSAIHCSFNGKGHICRVSSD